MSGSRANDPNDSDIMNRLIAATNEGNGKRIVLIKGYIRGLSGSHRRSSKIGIIGDIYRIQDQ
jgi:hypothetical protein